MLEQQYHLGRLISVHRPTAWRMWLLAVLIVFGPIAMLLLMAVILINDPTAFDSIRDMLLCFGVLGLLTFVLGAVLLSDYRAWRKSRSICLSIFEDGIVNRDNGNTFICRWNEIKHLRFKEIPWASRAFPGAKIKVIRAIVKTDGSVVSFPETLNLPRITEEISGLRRSAAG
jgi:hypothetical protein